MEDQGSFNGLGWFANYRLCWETGLDAFAQPLEPKEVESYDWTERNGSEYYLLNRKVKSRPLPMGFILMGDDENDFWLRFNNLNTLLLSDGTIDMYVNEMRRAFKVFYSRPSNAQAITLFTENGKVCARFTLEFIEPNPLDRSDYNVYFGASATVPNSESAIKALASAVYSPAGITFDTGTTYRTFSIVKRTDKALASVNDLTVGVYGDITLLFGYQSTIAVDGVNHDVYSIINAVPFSTNHNLKFLLA